MIRWQRTSTLFPYTTLFRSQSLGRGTFLKRDASRLNRPGPRIRFRPALPGWVLPRPAAENARVSRSEEHTSELQSQFHLVCRLLLEKKKEIDFGISGLHLAH